MASRDPETQRRIISIADAAGRVASHQTVAEREEAEARNLLAVRSYLREIEKGQAATRELQDAEGLLDQKYSGVGGALHVAKQRPY